MNNHLQRFTSCNKHEVHQRIYFPLWKAYFIASLDITSQCSQCGARYCHFCFVFFLLGRGKYMQIPIMRNTLSHLKYGVFMLQVSAHNLQHQASQRMRSTGKLMTSLWPTVPGLNHGLCILHKETTTRTVQSGFQQFRTFQNDATTYLLHFTRWLNHWKSLGSYDGERATFYNEVGRFPTPRHLCFPVIMLVPCNCTSSCVNWNM